MISLIIDSLFLISSLCAIFNGKKINVYKFAIISNKSRVKIKLLVGRIAKPLKFPSLFESLSKVLFLLIVIINCVFIFFFNFLNILFFTCSE